jgi:hypothetical protein
MSFETGIDVAHDVFCGTLTRVAPSNMPSGGSPDNLNVEFLPGLVRTRGGFQPQTSYKSVAGGPWQVRYTKSYAQVPESPETLALLVNPTQDPEGLMVAGLTVIGSVSGYSAQRPWAPYSLDPGFGGPLAFSCTQFGREYIAISDGRYGYDLPRQWDGTYYDRVSQCGPGQAPTVANWTNTVPIISLQQLNSSIAGIYEVGNICTVIFGNGGVLPGSTAWAASLSRPGDLFTIVGSPVAQYNGTWPLIDITYVGTLIAFTFYNPTTGLSNTAGGTVYTGITALVSSQLSTRIVGQSVTLSGVATGGYNSTWPVLYVPQGVTTQAWIYVNGTELPNDATGQMVIPGAIVAGLHQCSVAFITRQGYITRPAPPSSWIAYGGHKAVLTNIPIGPANVVARLLIFTPYLTPPAQTGTFYSIRSVNTFATSAVPTVMEIPDNTSVSYVVDFSDTELTSGFNAQYLFGLVELGCCSGCFPYASRMFWWGELNMEQDFLSMEFNSGWNGATPLGWTTDATYGGGGARLANGGAWLDAYQITGSGPLSINGMITQPAYQTWLGTPLLAPATQYGARVTASQALQPGSVAGLVLDIYSPSLGVNAQIPFASFGSVFTTNIADFNALTGAQIPADAVIRLYGQNMSAGDVFTIDRIELFPSDEPINYTVIRASNVEDPESFDGVTGLIQPAYSNGQAIRTIYTVRDSMYMVLDRSTYVTKDTGGDPATWTDDTVSAAIGAVGPHAAGAGEDWEVKANRYGLYLYIGREPQKISQEFQDVWDTINWSYGYKIWVAVDLQQKRVYAGVPLDGATENNTILVMDYNTLDTSEMIAMYPTLRFSPYTGRRVVLEQGRKWTKWNSQLVANFPCGEFVEQPGYTAEFLFGGGGDNTLYFIDPTNRGNDNGKAVDSYYITHFFPTQDEEQGLQIRSHLHEFPFLRPYMSGSGTVSVYLYEDNLNVTLTNPELIDKWDLANPAPFDKEITLDKAKTERWALKWETNAAGAWWQIEKMTRVLGLPPDALVRGSNLV